MFMGVQAGPGKDNGELLQVIASLEEEVAVLSQQNSQLRFSAHRQKHTESEDVVQTKLQLAMMREKEARDRLVPPFHHNPPTHRPHDPHP